MSKFPFAREDLIDVIAKYGASTTLGAMAEMIIEAGYNQAGMELNDLSQQIDDNEFADALEIDDSDYEEED